MIIIGVRFKKVGKIYYFDPDGLDLEFGQKVLVETIRGVELGEVAIENREVEDKEIEQTLKKIICVASKDDINQKRVNTAREKEAFDICKEKIAKHKLEMKLIAAEYTFDRSKILFYFTADGRIDFRELVKDLATVFRTRIELRQIGVRDKSKMVGGIGMCGRTLCCKTHLSDFQPVSINMAKDQGLSLNPVKISGSCGRLMCCLKYEQDVYEQMNATLPPVGSLVKTKDGKGTVTEVQILKNKIKVRIDGEDAPKEFSGDDVKVLKIARQHHPKEKLDPEVAKLAKE